MDGGRSERRKKKTEKISWELYQESMRMRDVGPQNQEAAKAYIPSPSEIKQRIKALRWLAQKQFSDELQDSIMIYDCPTIDVVIRMVKSVGVRETKRRLESFLSDE